MDQKVEIEFACLPLRTVGRLDVPLDAPPPLRRLYEGIAQAIRKHGSHNSYFLYNAHCTYHLTNNRDVGTIRLRFEGTVLTDPSDQKTLTSDLDVTLARETCDWLTEPIVAWFGETVSRSVAEEFDRYIAAGDLAQTLERIEKLQAESDNSGGFVGMYL